MRSLQKCVSDSKDDWDKSLESVLFAIRQSSTKFSSYEVAFGRKVILPIEHAIISNNNAPA